MGGAVGVLVNPIAGFGGPRGLHGTDGLTDDQFDQAAAEGRAAERMVRAVRRMLADTRDVEIVAPAGVLGADSLAAAGIPHRTVRGAATSRTDSSDTRAAVTELQGAGVSALLFAGGDGTAVDVAASVAPGLAVVGVPAGVKMHSEVFARSPEGAGRLLAQWATGDASLGTAEVLDVGVDGRIAPLAVVSAPRGREALQRAKSVAPPSAEREAVARDVVAAAAPDMTWIIGPGTGACAVAELLGFEPTLRGVDVGRADGSVEFDVDERRLLEIVSASPRPRLVLGVVGGQGFLLGRGNQQISSRVVAAIGAGAVEVVATTAKVGALTPPVLLVDSDAAGAHPLLGYRRVRTGARQSVVMKVLDAAADPHPTGP